MKSSLYNVQLFFDYKSVLNNSAITRLVSPVDTTFTRKFRWSLILPFMLIFVSIALALPRIRYTISVRDVIQSSSDGSVNSDCAVVCFIYPTSLVHFASYLQDTRLNTGLQEAWGVSQGSRLIEKPRFIDWRSFFAGIKNNLQILKNNYFLCVGVKLWVVCVGILLWRIQGHFATTQ